MPRICSLTRSTTSDLDLAASLFALAIHDAANWLNAEPRLQRARSFRLAEIGRECTCRARAQVEDDLWYTATVLARVLREDLGLAPSDVSTAFDVIGLPGESPRRSLRASLVSRARLETAVRRALADLGIDPFETDADLDDELDDEGDADADDGFDLDSTDSLAA